MPLQYLTKLRLLYLHNNQITDLAPLEYLLDLKEVTLDNNPLDPAQVDALQEALPSVKITYTP